MVSVLHCLPEGRGLDGIVLEAVTRSRAVSAQP